MKAILTGATGTLGRVLSGQLRAPVAWDRARTPPLDEDAARAFILTEKPDAFFHLAIASKGTGMPDEGRRINMDWPVQLATLCRDARVPFVFTSTAMVFSDAQVGPFTIESLPERADGYGREKRDAEEAVLSANHDSRIVRLGWQIGREPGSNNMIDFFARNQREKGEVTCSSRWFPACSFLEDTAAALIRVLDHPAGLYMIDSNTRWTFFEIGNELNRLHGNPWKIVPNEDFIYDQRLLDRRLDVPPLSQRLSGLT